METSQPTGRSFQPEGNININIDYIRNLEGATKKLDAIRTAFQAFLNLFNGCVSEVPRDSLDYECHSLMVLMGLQDNCINVYEEATYLLTMLFNFAYTYSGKTQHAHPIPGAPTPESQFEALSAIIKEGLPLVEDFEIHRNNFYRVLCETYERLRKEDQPSALLRPYTEYVRKNIDYIGRTLALIPKLDCVRVCFRAMPRLPDPEIIIETRLCSKSTDGQSIVTTRSPGVEYDTWMDIYSMVKINFNLYIDVVDLGGDGSYLSIKYLTETRHDQS